MYSPTAMLKLPAMRPAMPASTTVWESPDDAPATPMIRLTLATRPSVAPNTAGRRMLEPRVSWGLVGAASRALQPDRMAVAADRCARDFVIRRVSHAWAHQGLAVAIKRNYSPGRFFPLAQGGRAATHLSHQSRLSLTQGLSVDDAGPARRSASQPSRRRPRPSTAGSNRRLPAARPRSGEGSRPGRWQSRSEEDTAELQS